MVGQKSRKMGKTVNFTKKPARVALFQENSD